MTSAPATFAPAPSAAAPPPTSGSAPPGAPPGAQPFQSALADEQARTAPAEGLDNGAGDAHGAAREDAHATAEPAGAASASARVAARVHGASAARRAAHGAHDAQPSEAATTAGLVVTGTALAVHGYDIVADSSPPVASGRDEVDSGTRSTLPADVPSSLGAADGTHTAGPSPDDAGAPRAESGRQMLAVASAGSATGSARGLVGDAVGTITGDTASSTAGNVAGSTASGIAGGAAGDVASSTAGNVVGTTASSTAGNLAGTTASSAADATTDNVADGVASAFAGATTAAASNARAQTPSTPPAVAGGHTFTGGSIGTPLPAPPANSAAGATETALPAATTGFYSAIDAAGRARGGASGSGGAPGAADDASAANDTSAAGGLWSPGVRPAATGAVPATGKRDLGAGVAPDTNAASPNGASSSTPGTTTSLSTALTEVAAPEQTTDAASGAAAAPSFVDGVDLAQAIEALHATIALAARQGTTSARIALAPAELGEIRIHLSQTAEGLLARVTAQTPAAAQMLAGGQAQLRESLHSLGLAQLRLDGGAFHEAGAHGREQHPHTDDPAAAARRRAAGDDAAGEPQAQGSTADEDPLAPLPALVRGGTLIDVLA